MARVTLSRGARRELRAALAWIAADSPQGAEHLQAAVVKGTITLGCHPKAGVRRPEVTQKEVRFLVLPGVPYVIVYRLIPSGVEVLHILHGARDLPAVLRDDSL